MSGAREPQIESCPGACSLCGSPCAFINPHLFAQSCFCNDCVALGQIRGFGVPDDSRIQELWDGSGADQQAASSRSDANARSRSPRRSHEVTAQNVQAPPEYDEDGATELEDANAEPTPPHQQEEQDEAQASVSTAGHAGSVMGESLEGRLQDFERTVAPPNSSTPSAIGAAAGVTIPSTPNTSRSTPQGASASTIPNGVWAPNVLHYPFGSSMPQTIFAIPNDTSGQMSSPTGVWVPRTSNVGIRVGARVANALRIAESGVWVVITPSRIVLAPDTPDSPHYGWHANVLCVIQADARIPRISLQDVVAVDIAALLATEVHAIHAAGVRDLTIHAALAVPTLTWARIQSPDAAAPEQP